MKLKFIFRRLPSSGFFYGKGLPVIVTRSFTDHDTSTVYFYRGQVDHLLFKDYFKYNLKRLL